MRKGSPPPNFNQRYDDEEDEDEGEYNSAVSIMGAHEGKKSVEFVDNFSSREQPGFPGSLSSDPFEGLQQMEDYLQEEEENPSHQAFYSVNDHEQPQQHQTQFAPEDFAMGADGINDGFLPPIDTYEENGDIVDDSLDYPEQFEAEQMHYAAKKFQAGFRGYKGRKQVKTLRKERENFQKPPELENNMIGTDQDYEIGMNVSFFLLS